MTTPEPTPNSGAQALREALDTTFALLRWALALVALAYLASGVFIVPQHERAIVLLFGRASGAGADRALGPGLHWTWPRPFSEIVRVPTERVQSLTSRRFWAARATDRQEYSDAAAGLRPDADGYALTGDANLLHHRWAVRYTVDDPFHVRFDLREPDALLLGELDRAVVRASARFKIERALRTDVATFREAVESELRTRIERLALGVRIQGVDLLAIAPPAAVATSFDQVTEALQERDRLISDARADAVRIRNDAAGEADRLIAAGQADKQRRVSAVEGQADAFQSLRDAWRKNPQLVAQTLRQDELREVLSRAGRKLLIPQHSGEELRLNFGAPPAWEPEAGE